MLKKIALGFIILVVLASNVLRFWKLDTIPYGFHVDEMGSAVTMQCFSEKGCDAALKPWPVFGLMQYGQDKPPTYIYPGLFWVKIFGTTVPSLRGYGVFVFLIGILGLFFLANHLFGRACALVVILAATCSPWAWVVNRVALESYFAPVFAIWAVYFFWRSGFWWDWALAGFLFACAMYSYPPARLQIPLMMLTIGFYEWGRRSVRWQSALSLFFVFILSLLPMIAKYRDGSLSRRFNEISIFNKDYLHSLGMTGTPWETIHVFVHNYLLHLTPDFLFFTGDPSYVHSTRHLGLLSVLDIAAVVILIGFLFFAFMRPSWGYNPVVKNRRWLLFLAANFFIGIIPSALTNQELPHALRICGSWPFMMLFTGFIWWAAAECLSGCWLAIALVGAVCAGALMYQYFMIYPQESKGMFDYWVEEKAEQLKTQDDWQEFLLYIHRKTYDCRYFMVHGLGMTCQQANDLWWRMYQYLHNKGVY
ncbi:MAG: glycosyltransferase family 39 protein [Candidatus Omnitrophica bacterium]|nr:glycosyltransferase family 39 protein [Candidatus Omnitrophota bacterium]